MAGIRHKGVSTKVTKKVAFGATELLSLRSFCMQAGRGSKDHAAWTAVIVSFWACLRSDNVVPKSAAQFDPARQVCLKNMEWVTEGVVVKLGKSKTKRSQDPKLLVLIPRLDSLLDLCPVRAIQALIHSVAASKDGPLFLFWKKDKWSTLLYRDLLAVIKSWATSVGLDASSFGSHSARRGGATVAFKAGVNDLRIMKLGHWLSSAFLAYIKQDVADLQDVQMAMLVQMGEQVNSSR